MSNLSQRLGRVFQGRSMSNQDLIKMVEDMVIDDEAPAKTSSHNAFMETVIRRGYDSFIPNAMKQATGSDPQSFGQLDDLRCSIRVFISQTVDPLRVGHSAGETPSLLRNHTFFNDKTGSELSRLLFATEEEMKEDEHHPFYSIIRNFIHTSIVRIAGPQALENPDFVQLPDPVEGNAGFDHMIKLMHRYVLFMKGPSGSRVDPDMPYIPRANACDLIIVDLIFQNVLIKKIRDTVDVNRIMSDEEIADAIRKIYRTFVLDRTCHTSLLMLIAMNDQQMLITLVQAARASTSGPACQSSDLCPCITLKSD